MRIMITGVTGFVADHFLAYINEHEPGSIVLGLARHTDGFDATKYPNLNINVQQVDLLNRELVGYVLRNFSPEYILHLASVSSVALSWQAPLESFVNNTNIFLNVVEEMRTLKSKCRILSIGSSEEYGDVTEAELPLTEEHSLKPVSPYAVARVSQELLSVIYAKGYNLDIVISRSFNHIGPGQKDKFVISSFAKQLVQLAASNNAEKKIITGNLEIIRDFLDVRDVVKAYYLLLKKGKSGEIYNICSGRGIVLKDVITKMSEVLGINIAVEVNPKLIRPNENKKVTGSYKKLNTELGWKPELTLEDSIKDLIDYWKVNKD